MGWRARQASQRLSLAPTIMPPIFRLRYPPKGTSCPAGLKMVVVNRAQETLCQVSGSQTPALIVLGRTARLGHQSKSPESHGEQYESFPPANVPDNMSNVAGCVDRFNDSPKKALARRGLVSLKGHKHARGGATHTDGLIREAPRRA